MNWKTSWFSESKWFIERWNGASLNDGVDRLMELFTPNKAEGKFKLKDPSRRKIVCFPFSYLFRLLIPGIWFRFSGAMFNGIFNLDLFLGICCFQLVGRFGIFFIGGLVCQTVKIFLYKLSKFSFSNCQNFPFQNCQNSPFQTPLSEPNFHPKNSLINWLFYTPVTIINNKLIKGFNDTKRAIKSQFSHPTFSNFWNFFNARSTARQEKFDTVPFPSFFANFFNCFSHNFSDPWNEIFFCVWKIWWKSKIINKNLR